MSTSTINYHACLILLLDLSVRESHMRWGLTSAQEETRRQLKKQGLQTCLDVLSFCATKCSNAQTFVETVGRFQQLLDSRAQSSTTTSSTTESPRENFPPAVIPRTSPSDSVSSFSYSHLSAVSFPSLPAMDLSSGLASDRMGGVEFGGRLTTFPPTQISTTESAMPLESPSSSSTTYTANTTIPWSTDTTSSSDPNRLFCRATATNLDNPMVRDNDQSAQLLRMEHPQHHFQSFLQGFNPNYQDPRELYQYHQGPSFSTGGH